MNRCKRLYPLTVLATVTALAYGLLAQFRYEHFEAYGFDLGIFDQAIWHYSRFQVPGSDIRGLPNLLGDHFHPILMLLAPLFWFLHGAPILLWAQVILLASSVIPVCLFSQQRLGYFPGLLLATAYALSWELQATVYFDFHEVAFAVPLIAWAVWAMEARNWKVYAWCVLGLLLTKEDLSLLVSTFGIYLLVKREWKWGVGSLVLGLVWFTFIVILVIPYFAGGTYAHWDYGLGSNLPSALKAIFLAPLAALKVFVLPRTKLRTLWFLFHPYLLLSFCSPLCLLCVPLLAERFFGLDPAWWTTGFHYNATIVPVLAMSAADGLARLIRYWPSRHLALIATSGMAVYALWLVHAFPLANLLSANYLRLSASDLVGQRALSVIPAKASVTAEMAIISHLTERQNVEQLLPGAIGLDYVIVSSKVGSVAPLITWSQTEVVLNQTLARHSYTLIFNQDGWQVYRLNKT